MPKKALRSKNRKIHIFFEIGRVSIGKEIGNVSVRAQVEIRGSWTASLNCTDGETFPKPNGGTTSHPVKKTKTSLRFGDPLWPSFERNKFIVYYYTLYVYKYNNYYKIENNCYT